MFACIYLRYPTSFLRAAQCVGSGQGGFVAAMAGRAAIGVHFFIAEELMVDRGPAVQELGDEEPTGVSELLECLEEIHGISYILV